jgi:hypothetical protein
LSSSCSNRLGAAARAGQLTSEVVCVDDHLSLGQLSATQLSDISTVCHQANDTNLVSGQLPSLIHQHCSNGTDQNSFINQRVLQCSTNNNMGGCLEEAMIEIMEPEIIPRHHNDATPKRSPSSSTFSSRYYNFYPSTTIIMVVKVVFSTDSPPIPHFLHRRQLTSWAGLTVFTKHEREF